MSLLNLANGAYAGYQVLQWGMVYGESHQPSMTKDVHRISRLLIAMNCSLLLWKTIQPGNSLSKAVNWGFLGGACAGGAVDYFFLNRPTQARVPEEFAIDDVYIEDVGGQKHAMLGTTEVDWNAPKSQKLSRAIVVAQAIQILGGLYFSKNKLLSMIQLAGVIGTFSQIFMMQWVEVKHRSPLEGLTFQSMGPNHFGAADTAALSYPEISFFSLLPIGQNQEDPCPICADAVNSYYCSKKHPICSECLTEWYISKVKALASRLFETDRYEARFHYTKGQHDIFYRHTSTTYKIRFSEGDLPSCPSCRENPSHAFLKFKQGSVLLEGINPPKSNFWPSVYLLFSAAELTLALVQYTHPHLAGSIYKAQQVIVALGVVGLGALLYTESKIFKVNLASSGFFQIGVALSAILAASLIYRSYYGGAISQTHLLEKKVPQAELSTLSIDQTPPSSFRYLQWGYGSRTFLSLALAGVSDNKSLPILAALLNAAVLLKLSHMQWIRFEKTFTQGLSKYDKSISARFHFLIPCPEKMLGSNQQFSETFARINEYVSKFFDEASWNVYWYVTRNQYGQEISRVLKFDATVTPLPLKIDGLDFLQLVQEWGGVAVSHRGANGVLSIKVKTP